MDTLYITPPALYTAIVATTFLQITFQSRIENQKQGNNAMLANIFA